MSITYVWAQQKPHNNWQEFDIALSKEIDSAYEIFQKSLEDKKYQISIQEEDYEINFSALTITKVVKFGLGTQTTPEVINIQSSDGKTWAKKKVGASNIAENFDEKISKIIAQKYLEYRDIKASYRLKHNKSEYDVEFQPGRQTQIMRKLEFDEKDVLVIKKIQMSGNKKVEIIKHGDITRFFRMNTKLSDCDNCVCTQKKDGIFFSAKDGVNKDIIFELTDNQDEFFSITHIVIQTGKGDDALYEGLIFHDRFAPTEKSKEVWQKYNYFRKDQFEQKTNTNDRPDVFIQLSTEYNEFAVQFHQPLYGKFLHLKLLTNKGGIDVTSEIQIDQLNILGYIGEKPKNFVEMNAIKLFNLNSSVDVHSNQYMREELFNKPFSESYLKYGYQNLLGVFFDKKETKARYIEVLNVYHVYANSIIPFEKSYEENFEYLLHEKIETKRKIENIFNFVAENLDVTLSKSLNTEFAEYCKHYWKLRSIVSILHYLQQKSKDIPQNFIFSTDIRNTENAMGYFLSFIIRTKQYPPWVIRYLILTLKLLGEYYGHSEGENDYTQSAEYFELAKKWSVAIEVDYQIKNIDAPLEKDTKEPKDPEILISKNPSKEALTLWTESFFHQIIIYKKSLSQENIRKSHKSLIDLQRNRESFPGNIFQSMSHDDLSMILDKIAFLDKDLSWVTSLKKIIDAQDEYQTWEETISELIENHFSNDLKIEFFTLKYEQSNQRGNDILRFKYLLKLLIVYLEILTQPKYNNADLTRLILEMGNISEKQNPEVEMEKIRKSMLEIILALVDPKNETSDVEQIYILLKKFPEVIYNLFEIKHNLISIEEDKKPNMEVLELLVAISQQIINTKSLLETLNFKDFSEKVINSAYDLANKLISPEYLSEDTGDSELIKIYEKVNVAFTLKQHWEAHFQKNFAKALLIAEKGRSAVTIKIIEGKCSGISELKNVDKTLSIDTIKKIAEKSDSHILYYSLAKNYLYIWLIKPNEFKKKKGSLLVQLVDSFSKDKKKNNKYEPTIIDDRILCFSIDLQDFNFHHEVVALNNIIKKSVAKLEERTTEDYLHENIDNVLIEETDREINEFRKKLNSSSYKILQDKFNIAMKKFQNYLIDPVSAYLPIAKDSKLIIIPHLDLNSIPFHALEYNHEPLLDHFNISISASLKLIQVQISQLENSQQYRRGRLMNTGNPRQIYLLENSPAKPQSKKVPKKPQQPKIVRTMSTPSTPITETQTTNSEATETSTRSIVKDTESTIETPLGKIVDNDEYNSDEDSFDDEESTLSSTSSVSMIRGTSTLSHLPNSKAEVRDISILIGNYDTRKFEAVELNRFIEVKENAKKIDLSPKKFETCRPQIIHIVCHSDDHHKIENRKYGPTGGFLFGDDYVYADEIENNLNLLGAELVVISSCFGAGGKINSMVGPRGLVHAFFCANSPSVVASLWKANDLVTKHLMVKFYEELLKGHSKSFALRNALNYMKTKWKGALRKATILWASFYMFGVDAPLSNIFELDVEKQKQDNEYTQVESIDDIQIKSFKTGKYTTYMIYHKLYEVEKRYSEILKFHNKLKNRFKKHKLPEFPPKQLNNSDIVFLNQRKVDLEKYLNGLLEFDDIERSDIFLNFWRN